MPFQGCDSEESRQKNVAGETLVRSAPDSEDATWAVEDTRTVQIHVKPSETQAAKGERPSEGLRKRCSLPTVQE